MRGIFHWMTVIGGILLAANAGATLVARNFDGTSSIQGYYDTDLGITWLQDANFAKTSGFDSDGLMTWSTAKSWASGLNLNGISGWRLADVAQPDANCSGNDAFNGSTGTGCTTGELGHMFYVTMGGTANVPIATSHNANYDLISNLQTDYWSMHEIVSRGLVYFFYEAPSRGATVAGYVSLDFPDQTHFAWAVHNGDVGRSLVSDVPEPGTMALLALGIAGLGFSKRQKARGR